MSEEEKKNKLIEDDDSEDDSEDDDYRPSDDEDKGLSFEQELSTKLNSLKSFSLINPFLFSNNDEVISEEDEDNLEDLAHLNRESDDEESKEQVDEKLSEEEEKKRAEELWADLIGSSTNQTNDKNSNQSFNKLKTSSTNLINSSTINKLTNLKADANNSSTTSKSEKVKIIKEYEFAGEKVKVEEEIDYKLEMNSKSKKSTSVINNPMKRGLGINNLVANLGKKQKLTTLNKTKLDWDLFKKEEGIEEDLKNHTKDKTSFVEKQAFLQRTDLKQFELEKTVREKNRTFKN